MGKTPKPLVLIIDDSLDSPVFHAMTEQGHKIHLMSSLELNGIDLILGPQCWNMVDLEYLDTAIKESRKKRYPKSAKAKKAPKKRKAKGKTQGLDS